MAYRELDDVLGLTVMADRTKVEIGVRLEAISDSSRVEGLGYRYRLSPAPRSILHPFLH